MNRDTKDGLLTLGVIVFAIIVLLLIGWGTSWFGLVTSRPMAKYAEDTRRLTFEHSRARISGANGAIVDYCLNMRRSTDPAQKTAMAGWIVGEAEGFEGELSPAAGRCVGEAQTILGL